MINNSFVHKLSRAVTYARTNFRAQKPLRSQSFVASTNFRDATLRNQVQAFANSKFRAYKSLRALTFAGTSRFVASRILSSRWKHFM